MARATYSARRRYRPWPRTGNQAGGSNSRRADGGGLCGQSCAVADVQLAGVRIKLTVPMLKEGDLIGFIEIYRQVFGLSPTSRSSWLRTSPTKPLSPSRTLACSNELREFAAAADRHGRFLRVISRSAIDVQAVLDTLIRNAVDFATLLYGAVFRYDGELTTLAAHHKP